MGFKFQWKRTFVDMLFFGYLVSNINQKTLLNNLFTILIELWSCAITEGCLLCFRIRQPSCWNLTTDSFIVKLNIFEFSRTQHVSTYERSLYFLLYIGTRMAMNNEHVQLFFKISTCIYSATAYEWTWSNFWRWYL